MFRIFFTAMTAALLSTSSHAEEQQPAAQSISQVEQSVDSETPTTEKKPYRTFLNIQRYTIENDGNPNNSISNVRLEVLFPNQDPEKQVKPMWWERWFFGKQDESVVARILLPGGEDQWWPIGDGQVQEINQIFEVPWEYIQNDGFRFTIKIHRKGTVIKPCVFDVVSLSEFNRSYICRLDENWQLSQNIPEDQLDKEGVQLRIFTDKNSPAKDIPKDAIALK